MNGMNFIIFGVLILSIFSCGDNPTIDNGGILADCPDKVIIDKDDFLNADKGDLNISNIEINDDCLIVTIQASGCDGSQWTIDLIDGGDIAESLPPQRFLKFDFVNTEECDALPTQEYSFDIRSLKLENEKSVFLNFSEFDKSILYEF